MLLSLLIVCDSTAALTYQQCIQQQFSEYLGLLGLESSLGLAAT